MKMSRLDEIKSIFFGEGYTISNNRGLDKKGLGQWVDDTHWLIEKVEKQQKEIERLKDEIEQDGWNHKEEMERMHMDWDD
jgi:hypothetical protein